MSIYNKKYYQQVYSKYIGSPNPKVLKLSKFWMYNIFEFHGYELSGKKVLDFGCGPGHLTVSIKAECYDVSQYIMDDLQESGRLIVRNLQNIKSDSYDYILASHSLEHSWDPRIELLEIKRMLNLNGNLFLILPIEDLPGQFPIKPDIHQHLYAWNFQNIVNLLVNCGFEVLLQDIIYGPTGMSYSNNMSLIRKFGRIKKHNPSIFIIARKIA